MMCSACCKLVAHSVTRALEMFIMGCAVQASGLYLLAECLDACTREVARSFGMQHTPQLQLVLVKLASIKHRLNSPSAQRFSCRPLTANL